MPLEMREEEKLENMKVFFWVLEADEIRYHLIASFKSAALILLLQKWCFIALITHNTFSLTHTHTRIYTLKDCFFAGTAEKVLSVPHAVF